MPDLDQLDPDLRALAEHGARSARALPAADVRRRGTHRRRLRIGGTALTSAAAVALGVVAAGAFTARDGGQGPPALRATASSRALPPAVLPDGLDLGGYNEFTGWATAATPARERPADPTSVCQRSTLKQLGAVDVRLRTYRLTGQLQPGQTAEQPESLRPTTRIAVAQFPDARSGRAAFVTMQDWVRTCPERLAATWRVTNPTRAVGAYSAVDDAGAAGLTYLLTYSGHDAAFDNASWLDLTAVGVSSYGDRVVLISQRNLGEDYDYIDPDTAPITKALSTALGLIGS